MRRIIPVIIIILSLAGAFLYVWPGYQEINLLREEEAVLDDGLIKAKEAEDIRQELEGKLNAISSEQRHMLDRALPKAIDDIRLANDIQGIAANNNIDISNISIEVGEDDGSEASSTGAEEDTPILRVAEVKESTISFDVNATYDTFLDFMVDLQDSLQLFDFISVGFTQNDEGLNSYSISLRTYSLPDKTL